MSNQFDSTNYPTREPAELIVGDRWMWKRTDLGADYPPASYSLKYSLRLEGAATEIEITASESGSDYVVEVPSATTAGYTPGRYRWQAYMIRDSDSQRITLEQGSLDIVPNRDASTADPRSHVKKVLDAIEAVIEGRATKDQMSYSIAGRSLDRTSIPDLLLLREKYSAAHQAERVKEQLAKTGINPRRIGVRFARV